MALKFEANMLHHQVVLGPRLRSQENLQPHEKGGGEAAEGEGGDQGAGGCDGVAEGGAEGGGDQVDGDGEGGEREVGEEGEGDGDG